jgi:hypothetical protein
MAISASISALRIKLARKEASTLSANAPAASSMSQSNGEEAVVMEASLTTLTPRSARAQIEASVPTPNLDQPKKLAVGAIPGGDTAEVVSSLSLAVIVRAAGPHQSESRAGLEEQVTLFGCQIGIVGFDPFELMTRNKFSQCLTGKHPLTPT